MMYVLLITAKPGLNLYLYIDRYHTHVIYIHLFHPIY